MTNSGGWVFPYWSDFGRSYRKENGIYVPDNELVRLALITFEERRATNIDVDLFIDVRKYGWEEVLKMNNEKWNDILRNGVKERCCERDRGMQNKDNSEKLRLWY